MSKHKHNAHSATIATFALLIGLFLIEPKLSGSGASMQIGKVAHGAGSSIQTSAGTSPGLSAASASSTKCGNGIVDAAEKEECDLGRDNGLKAGDESCTKSCTIPKCGNQIVEVENTEECEPQYMVKETINETTKEKTITKTPIIPNCGDYCAHPTEDEKGKLTGGCYWINKPCAESLPTVTEAMFDRYVRTEASSSSSLSSVSVGASSVAAGSSVPLVTSTASACGNGKVDVGEVCDQGERNSGIVPNACRTNCTLPICGDGVIDTMFGETCDDGDKNSNTVSNACRLGCTPSLCGDNVIDTGEQCDGGPNCSDTCTNLGTLSAGCGNGLIEPGEICDDGNVIDGDGCNARCMGEVGACGNAILDLGEECDDGNKAKGDGCTEFCSYEVSTCGNKVIDLREECDEGDRNSDSDPDRCRANCKKAACGDGTLDSNEECDDGNKSNRDNCTNFCLLPDCGDGFRQTLEQCDDGNVTSNDGCSKRCMLESGHSAATPEQRNMMILVFAITSVVGFMGGIFTGWKWMGLR